MKSALTFALLSALVAASQALSYAASPVPAYGPVPTYGSTPSPSNPPPSTPTLCSWYPAAINPTDNKTLTLPSCGINSAWLATLEAELGPDTSALARQAVIAAKYNAICQAMHDMSTAEGKASCRADRENGCAPSWTGQTCFSGLGDKIFAAAVCEGSSYQKYLVCQGKFVDECGGPDGAADADGCAWSPLVWYGGIEAYEATSEQDEVAMGGPLTFGACFPKSLVDAVLTSDGQYSDGRNEAWFLENAGNPNNMTQFFEQRGTCPYASMAFLRNEYSQKCRALNAISTPNGPYLNTIDYNSIAACQAAGCSVRWVNGAVLRNQGYPLPESYWFCTMDNAIWNMKYAYDVRTDGKVPLAALLCGSDRLQFDKAACMAAAL